MLEYEVFDGLAADGLEQEELGSLAKIGIVFYLFVLRDSIADT